MKIHNKNLYLKDKICFLFDLISTFNLRFHHYSGYSVSNYCDLRIYFSKRNWFSYYEVRFPDYSYFFGKLDSYRNLFLTLKGHSST